MGIERKATNCLHESLLIIIAPVALEALELLASAIAGAAVVRKILSLLGDTICKSLHMLSVCGCRFCGATTCVCLPGVMCGALRIWATGIVYLCASG